MTRGNTNSLSSPPGLNDSQARRLRVTCQYIDKVLGDVETILNADSSKAAFPRYASDITPAQRGTIEDYVARLRAQLIRVLDGQRIPREEPSIPASRAVHVLLGAIDIAAEELKPKYMRGYGTLPEPVATELNGIAAELSGLIDRFDRYLSGPVGEDLGIRLARLEHDGNDLDLLKRIETAVRARGLVEFRSAIAAILDRAEDRSFEIAMFGRVSAGKSSLLNAILERDVLPVGVTPITAVPTRITHGEKPSLTVWFSETPRKELEIARLPEFATERQNPGNTKHVTRLVAALPAPRLKDGIAFVDTPGLGSLATSGAGETLAYLPKCDLGVVLIDAGSALTPDDMQTILALKEAAVPVNVLLSKADLLDSDDRARSAQYVKDHVASQCKMDLTVHPVSVTPSGKHMLDGWFENQIVPLYERSQELRAASMQRKIGALRDSVAVSLEARLRRRGSSVESADRARATEERLRRATGQMEETRSLCERFIGDASASMPEAIDEAAKRFLHFWSRGSYGVVVPGQLIRDSLTQFIQLQVRKLQGEIAHLASEIEQALQQSSADLGVPDAPSQGEFQLVIRGAPTFDSSGFDLVVTYPRFARFLGTRITGRQVARQISRHLRQPFYSALETHWELTRVWMESVVGQLKQKFETYAENYRAHAGVVVADKDLTKTELDAIEEDIAGLKQPDRDAEFVQTTSTGNREGAGKILR